MWYVLKLVDHGQAINEKAQYGGVHSRHLNVTGRWSSLGNRAVPLLAWRDRSEAQAAAEVVRRVRSREIALIAIGGQEAGVLQEVVGHGHAALSGYLPYAAAAARAMSIDVEKTMDYAAAVLAVLGPDRSGTPEAAAKVAAQGLQKKFGGGSVVSAAQFLSGRRAADVLSRVMDGEEVCQRDITLEQLVLAFAIARGIVGQLR